MGDRRDGDRGSPSRSRAPATAVVVAGKGHETGQEVAGVVHPFDDRDVLRAALREPGRRVVIALTLRRDRRGRRRDVVRRRPGPAVVVTGPAFIDSREAEPGGLFAAFVGEQVDGHDYAAAAVAGGAAAVLGSTAGRRPRGRSSTTRRPRCSALARHVLGRAADDLTVVGLTGSQGKTSTKDLLAAVLAAAGADGGDPRAPSTTSSGCR